MNSPNTRISVDDVWLEDWAAEGVAAIERLLASHAAFAEYLAGRGVLDSDDGDCRQDA